MINRVIIENFKKFEHLEFELADHLVIAGPNNCGKTTLLQSIAAWSEIAIQWTDTSADLARKQDGNYPHIGLNLLRFHSVPLADFDHLWPEKNVGDPSSIWLQTDQWRIGFEILYNEQELASVRPAKGVNEENLERFMRDPLRTVYVPPLSGPDIAEAPYDPLVIPARLARAQAGSVLRNLLLAVSQDFQKWQDLCEVVRAFFGYELDYPSRAHEILARYRHSAESSSLDLSSAASGFLQVLLVYSALLQRETSVVLMDEPDAHLHILLQDKLYGRLCQIARQSKSQLIIATHSERLIRAAGADSLRLLTGEIRRVKDKRKLPDTMRLEQTDILLAETEPGILYIEGATDIPLLREWARVTRHQLLSFLEKPFGWHTAENTWPAVRHFSAMRLMVPELLGVELHDRDEKEYHSPETVTSGMIRIIWKRREIESYLIHPEAITRFVEDKGGRQAAERATQYMKREFPIVLYEAPFELSGYASDVKAKNLLGRIFHEARLRIREADYFQIAAEMTIDEIHPEVIEKLDAIAEHFNL